MNTVTIKTIDDLKNATRCDGDGQAEANGDFVLDNGQAQNEECYSDIACPTCGVGCVFGADFPNGEGDGQCLNCGTAWTWNNDEAEWKSI